MRKSAGCFRINEVLKLFPHLEKLMLDVSIDFESGPTLMHTNLKHLTINKLDFNLLIKVMQSLPKLKSLEITDDWFPFGNYFLQHIQAAIPQFLKRLMTFGISHSRNTFPDKVTTLQEIIQILQSCKIKLIGNCDFKKFSETIDKSIKRKICESNNWMELSK